MHVCQAGETRKKHEVRDFIDKGLAVAETERAKAALVSFFKVSACKYTSKAHLVNACMGLKCFWRTVVGMFFSSAASKCTSKAHIQCIAYMTGCLL